MVIPPKNDSGFPSKSLPGYLLILPAILLSGGSARSNDPDRISTEPAKQQVEARTPDFDRTFANALPYSYEAERQGLTVDDAEVDRRLETYRKLYPATEMSKGKVRVILLAEAYLDRQGAGAGSREPAARSEELKLEKFHDEGELERARQSLQTRALFEREEIKSGGRKLFNQENLRKRLNRPPPKESWPVGELQLPGNPRACLAWLGSDCLVTVEEFNVAAGQFEFRLDLSLDSARIGVLRKYALAKEAAANADAYEPGLDRQDLLTTYKKAREITHWLNLAKDFGLPQTDEKVLRIAYQKYYQRYFQAHDDVTLSLIGSSDSAYIDSLHGTLVRWRGESVSRKDARIPANKEPPLPWIDYMEADLPPGLVAPTDTFRVGDFTAPIRTPFGFFIVKLSKSVPVKEVGFQDAIGMLAYLMTRDDFLELDSLAELKVKQYYDRHPQEFSLPDTLELRAWLAPALSAGRAQKSTPATVAMDTLRFRPLHMSSMALPEPVRLELQKAVRKEPRKAFIGPFEGLYGRWHFHVKRARNAEGRIPYGIASRSIRGKMSTLPRPARDTLTSDATKDQVILNLALARRNRDGLGDRVERVSREFEERIRSGAIDTARFPEGEERSKAIELARIELEEEFWDKSRERDNDFLARIRIDYRLLN